MITSETLMNFRIQLHMFVYPQHIDRFINSLSSLMTQGKGYFEYDAQNKRIIMKPVKDTFSVNDIQMLFCQFLSSPEVEDALKACINEEAFNDYKNIIVTQDNYKYLYNMTVISISKVQDAYVIQL